MLTRNELNGAPAGVFEAIERYVSCGGTLIVVGTGALPVAWQREMSAFNEYTTIATVGFGTVLAISNTNVAQWSVEQFYPISSNQYGAN